MATVYEFNCTGSEQSVTLSPGKYKLECWGASGGGGSDQTDLEKCSKGGYSKGEILLKKQTTLYIYAGGWGFESYPIFNGGGKSLNNENHQGVNYRCNGGGATDIRLVGGSWDNQKGLLSRIIVAGGGGRNFFNNEGGDGGGYNGGSGGSALGGTQSAGGKGSSGTDGLFGKGGNAISTDTGKNFGGGGGGWYGGGSGVAGGGGSGYVLTKDSYKPTGYIPTSEHYLSNVSTITGGGLIQSRGKAQITLLEGHPSVSIISYSSTQSTFRIDHTNPNKLAKIEWFVDSILKETFTTDLYAQKTINYELTDNAIHTLKIVATDLNGIIAEKVVSISKSIMPLEDDASLQDIASKVSEIKEGLINGKTSIINVLALKNIESSLNNSLVELSENIKKSFDSSDASVQDLQNKLTEKNNTISQLNNQIKQRKRWATGSYTFTAYDNYNFYIKGQKESATLDILMNLDFVPSIIIINALPAWTSKGDSILFSNISNLNDINLGSEKIEGAAYYAKGIIKISNITSNSFKLILSNSDDGPRCDDVEVRSGGVFTWRAYE
ncbi:TPA: glycine-rich protein [Clostridioides difficile]